MDQNGAVNFRHRRSPSSDRFLNVFSPPLNDSAISAAFSGEISGEVSGDELNEDDVVFDFTEPQQQQQQQQQKVKNFHQPEKFGILAALPESHRLSPVSGKSSPVVYRKTSIASSPPIISPSPPPREFPAIFSPSPPARDFPAIISPSPARDFPAIPKPPATAEMHGRIYSQTLPARKFQHSAPMNVPMRKSVRIGADVDDDVDNDDEEMLPPHEIVARGSSRSPKTTFSVLEGAGRTLKGRDLRQVRNAVFRQTGFID